MIIIMNLFVALIGLLSVVLTVQFFSDVEYKDYLKYHWFFLFVKLILVSAIIYGFTYNQTEKKMWMLSGGLTFVIFHFVEGFLAQRKMNKKA